MATKKKPPAKTPTGVRCAHVDPLIGPVLIRDNLAGVIVGQLVSYDLAAGTWTLAPGARKIHYWRRAGAVEGIAVRGIDPNESRMTAPVSRVSVGRAMIQILGLTRSEYDSLMVTPEWRP